MFNGMMDPELMRLAQEQMSRMSPAEFARIQQQMMSNPELVRMASESMRNLRPEDLRKAAEQLKYTRPEDMAEIGEKMANATPEELAAMRARLDAQVTYEINAAEMLKKQGNELHTHGKYNDASQKYLLAKKNLKSIPSSKSRSLSLACSLNLMSCYLKTRQYDECISEGTEVLGHDAKNVKALYRRGQAYKEIGRLQDAVPDLSKALEVSPDDETIAEVLRDTKERLVKEGGEPRSRGVTIEEITEEMDTTSTENCKSSTADYSFSQSPETSTGFKNGTEITKDSPSTNSECLQALKDDPESIRSFQNFISQADPETMARISAGKTEGIPPYMLKTASNMISQMSPEELQRMLRLASSFQGENPFLKEGSGSNTNGFGPCTIQPEITPDMLKTATDMMSKMSKEEIQKMFEMASSLKGRDTVSAAAALHSNGIRSENGSRIQESQESSTSGGDYVGESSSSRGFLNATSMRQSSFPSSSAGMQEQIRNQMKDPAMGQMFSSMMKNMSPEMMANISEQVGFKLSREDAEKAQQAMSSMSPDDLDRMMRWMDRIQRGVEGARQTKNWLLGRPGMILAIFMLILAVILHWLGYIGR